MTDKFTKSKRSEIMSHIKGTDTTPELIIRKLIHSLGYRYRLHYPKLPGKPDIAFPGRKKVIFVNGCFWHGHNCKKGKLPETNKNFWNQKIRKSIERDKIVQNLLTQQGWKFLVIWQCEIRSDSISDVKNKIVDFLKTK